MNFEIPEDWPQQLLILFVIGALIGGLAGRLVGARGFGIIGDAVIGILGAGLAAVFYNVVLKDTQLFDWPDDLQWLKMPVGALIGATTLLLIGKLSRRRKKRQRD